MRCRTGRQPPQFLTWAAILGYVLVASGLPLPVGAGSRPVAESPGAKRLAGKDRSRPFPCMDKPCGCATAEQCFTSCCCHTPAQTLAWARAHEVAPAVLAALERRAAAEPRTAGSACCGTKSATPACSTASLDLDGPEICAEYRSLATAPAPVLVEDSSARATAAPEPRSRVVTLRAMLACGGIVAEWFSCGVSLPPQGALAAVVTYAPAVVTLAVSDDQVTCVPSIPDLPPPRA